MMVPIEPYSTLYLLKLVTKTEKANEDKMLRKVVVRVPGEVNFHCFSTDGAYLKIKPMAKNISNIIKTHLVFAKIFRQVGSDINHSNKAPCEISRIK